MRNIIILLCIITFAGCATPIKKEIASSQIVKDTGIGVSSIIDIIHSSFAVTSKISKKAVWRNGVVAVTDSEFFIYAMNPSNEQLEQDLCISYSEMQGINLLIDEKRSQIQILGVIGIVALELMDPDLSTIDQKASEKLFGYIKGKMVPIFPSKGMIENPFIMPLIIPIPIPNSFIL